MNRGHPRSAAFLDNMGDSRLHRNRDVVNGLSDNNALAVTVQESFLNSRDATTRGTPDAVIFASRGPDRTCSLVQSPWLANVQREPVLVPMRRIARPHPTVRRLLIPGCGRQQDAGLDRKACVCDPGSLRPAWHKRRTVPAGGGSPSHPPAPGQVRRRGIKRPHGGLRRHAPVQKEPPERDDVLHILVEAVRQHRVETLLRCKPLVPLFKVR